MKWTLRQIQDNPSKLVSFDESLEIKEELLSRDDTIIDVKHVHAKGLLSWIDDAYILSGIIRADLVLPSSRSLNPVDVQLDIPIDERYVHNEQNLDEEYSGVTLVLEHDYIDLTDAVVDAIILNLPKKVLSPGEADQALPSGNDWEVLTQDEYEARLKEEQASTVDPRFAALKTLLNQEDQD